MTCTLLRQILPECAGTGKGIEAIDNFRGDFGGRRPPLQVEQLQVSNEMNDLRFTDAVLSRSKEAQLQLRKSFGQE